ncbi:23S rRNA m(2)A-2503 methyltransferase [Desulfuromusa kysingii]|uniref:Probable dual-specificity RNA methyltransferase RlmN n=1 Tax=Desulfuromusa kysingii TaxID=37625 RepID=A0A1H4BF71_9BACT|nr:23S rRNA (adenine(2503)-C(2))-methyltransferase RlmN [Desulfuromusa kysingii]SEA46747.1 23S rRNA m(2)A-2503 methyltransferase [Desulfuromusa kysingii]
MSTHKIDLKSLNCQQLEEFLSRMGKEKYRAKQILHWIYQRHVLDFEEMTDLAKKFRCDLAEQAFISSFLPEMVETSEDGTRKYLFRLDDGQTIEAVRIPMDESRATLCISTQVGCAMGCQFCMTGTFGLARNLRTEEIVNQVCAALQDGPISNIVLMGMGEPLHNLDNVVTALQILYLDDGLGYGTRRVTLSTCGLVPEIRELSRRIKVNLAVSLNASTNEIRDRLMPVNQRYPLEELLPACRDYAQTTKQRVTFEYILIGDVNNSIADAKRLVALLHGVRCKVNLIAYNEHQGAPFNAPSEESIKAFQSYLLQRDIVATLRASKGQDISAACGQLKGKFAEQSLNCTFE